MKEAFAGHCSTAEDHKPDTPNKDLPQDAQPEGKTQHMTTFTVNVFPVTTMKKICDPLRCSLLRPLQAVTNVCGIFLNYITYNLFIYTICYV